MKKISYLSPDAETIELRLTGMLMGSVTDIGGNSGIGYGGGGSGPARSPRPSWDDDGE